MLQKNKGLLKLKVRTFVFKSPVLTFQKTGPLKGLLIF